MTRSTAVFSLLLAKAILIGTASRTNGASISQGEVRPGIISASAKTNSYTFTGKANDLVTLGLIKTDTGAGNPTIRLFDPEGAYILGACGDGVRVFLDALPLAKTGTYLIEVSDCDSQNGSYGYLLSLSAVAPGVNQREVGDGPEPITFGQTTTGHIRVADFDTYTFRATAGERVSLSLIKTDAGSGNPTIRLFDPQGVDIWGACGDGLRAYASGGVTLTTEGTYVIEINDCNNLDRSYPRNGNGRVARLK
jgi:hypothetical protein